MDFTYDNNTFSDLHKEVHGWRPSNSLMVEWNERTPRQKQELWTDVKLQEDHMEFTEN